MKDQNQHLLRLAEELHMNIHVLGFRITQMIGQLNDTTSSVEYQSPASDD